jgi:histone acetyltransferase (RNA polymerase elongator complex component)
LVERAEQLARSRGKPSMAVIAALGTRGYYRKLGYALGETYMLKMLR